MPAYLLIESRDPFEDALVPRDYELARDLARGGRAVTLFLVQNGVLPARGRARSAELEAVAAGGVRVLADDFSLRERGIDTAELAAGVGAAPIEHVVDRLAAGDRVLWL